ncbi:hypothetical protein QM012_005865 [Aureobasidium pullulans]|uniref:Uncharacterized protein n=1 Tax=Aureobasidium pullulans TaxID=5580 RepID=A0ABR0TQZ4_AURPU
MPPDPKEKSLKKLVRYAVTQLCECKRRASICLCQYQHINTLNLDNNEDFDDHDWTTSKTSRRPRSEILHYRGICQQLYKLLHQDDLLRNPYLTWSNEILITSLKRRGIALPRTRNKSAYALALQHADTTRTFAFMELPQEIKLLVYEMALTSDAEDNHRNPPNSRPLTKPTLLQTCRQIRADGTVIFYRINCFVLRFQRDALVASDRRSLSWLKNYVGADHLQHLRYITLAISRCCGCMGSHIKIDLGCRDPLKWTVQGKLADPRHHFTCKNLPQQYGKTTFLQERNYLLAKLSQGTELIASNTAAAHKTIDELWEACGESGRMGPSLSGFLDLTKAVQEIDRNLTRGYE